MFRLNGDIIRQLSKHYRVAFKEKYKKEIKERINQYINHYIEKLNMTFLEKLKYMEDKIKIQDNKIICISYELFNNELFSIFNEEWININTEKTYYTKKEERDMFNCFKQEMMIKTFNKYYYKDINQELINNFDTNKMYRKEDLEKTIKINLTFFNDRTENHFSLNNDILRKTNINYDFIKKRIKKINYINNFKEIIKDKIQRINLYHLYQQDKGFINYTIVMNTERTIIVKKDMVEKIFNENIVKEENKRRIVLSNNSYIQFEEIEVGKKEIIAVGYENIAYYIVLYIKDKFIEEIEKFMDE